MKKKVTIKNIAKETGFSIATISRVINKTKKHYSKETEKKISKTIKSLNYTPNIIAWGLKKKKTNTIGLIVPELDSYYTEIFLGAQDTAMKYGYAIFLCNSNYKIKFEKIYIDNLLARRVDGVIIASGLMDKEQVNRLIEEGIKIALIETDIKIEDTVKIFIDNYKSSKMAVQHLIDNGYKNIGYISAPIEEMSNLQDRYRGYLDALQENNLKFNENMVHFNKAIRGEWDLTTSSELIESIMLKSDHPDSLFIISDAVAMLAIHTIKKLGFKIPDDVGVVGFDDRRSSKYLDPPLTSVYQPKYEMGSKSMELLIKILENKEVKNKIFQLDMKLSIRESSLRNKK